MPQKYYIERREIMLLPLHADYIDSQESAEVSFFFFFSFLFSKINISLFKKPTNTRTYFCKIVLFYIIFTLVTNIACLQLLNAYSIFLNHETHVLSEYSRLGNYPYISIEVQLHLVKRSIRAGVSIPVKVSKNALSRVILHITNAIKKRRGYRAFLHFFRPLINIKSKLWSFIARNR